MRTLVLIALLVFPAFAWANAREQTWQPPNPDPKGDEWIQLTSGEWLRGEINLLRDGDLDFESEELDELKLDFEDVAAIRSPRTLTFVFTEDRSAAGTSVLQDNVLTILSGGDTLQFRREDLLSILEGSPSELNYWSLKLSLGLVGRTGNTDQGDLNAILILRREAKWSRLDLNYTGNWGELDGTQNINNHLANGSFDLFFSRRVFITPLSVEFYADEFQNIRAKYSVGGGFGYYFIRESDVEWRVGLSGAFRSTEYRSVEAGEENRKRTGAVGFDTMVDWDLSDAFELDLGYNVQVGVPEVKDAFHHLQALFTMDIYDPLDFTVSFTWDRSENPQRNADGVLPKRDDFRTSIGIGLSY